MMMMKKVSMVKRLGYAAKFPGTFAYMLLANSFVHVGYMPIPVRCRCRACTCCIVLSRASMHTPCS